LFDRQGGETTVIDIHSHILPGLDDGASDIHEALRMCDIAISEGIRTIVATPHTLNGIYENGREDILRATARLKEAIREKAMDIDVLPGSDTHLDVRLPEMLRQQKALTINDNQRFLLLELPSFFIAEHVGRQVIELNHLGITPIISHPERNVTLREDMNIIHDLIRAGALLQITADSITGKFGRAAEKSAFKILESDMAHILATDAHNATSRPPAPSAALEIIKREIGAERTRGMVLDIPECIIKGSMPFVRKPLRKKTRSFFSLFGLGGR
jgi:protein-tyrosine phosphatase